MPRTSTGGAMFDVTDPSALLAAIDRAHRSEPLPKALAALVNDALRERTWALLSVASRGLRMYARCFAEDNMPVPSAVDVALAQIRQALAARKGGAR
jgi:hypothetical protein